MSNKASFWRKVWVVFMGGVFAPAVLSRMAMESYQWTSIGYDRTLNALWNFTPTIFVNSLTIAFFKAWAAVVFVVGSALPGGVFWGYAAIRMITLQDWLTVGIIAVLLMCVRPPELPARLRSMIRR